jgi:hypothetical protein
MFGCIPQDERVPWHRFPEIFYLFVDLFKLLKPTLTVMDGLVIQEGFGPRFGTPVDWGVIVVGKDPVATEAVTVFAMGHEPYEQAVLPIAAKAGQGTMDIHNIDVRGESIRSILRYCKLAPGDFFINSDPHIVEYCGGACNGCAAWIQSTPYPWEIDPKKKYALLVGITPRLPDTFEEDEVIVLGNCAIRSKNKIEDACKAKGLKPQYIGGCPPYEHRKPGYLKLHKIDKLPYTKKIKRVKE